YVHITTNQSQAVYNSSLHGESHNTIHNPEHDVFITSRVRFQSHQRRFRRHGVTAIAQRPQSLNLYSFNCRIDAKSFDLGSFVALKLIYPDDNCFLRLDGPLIFVSRVLNLSLNVAGLDRAQRSAHSIDLILIVTYSLLDFMRQLFDSVRARKSINNIGNA